MRTIVKKKVKTIVFSVLSPKNIKDMSSVKVITAELYDKEGYPVDGGLIDLRLGVIDPGLRCKTCGGKLKECTGHFGHIDIARPIIHIKYVRVILNALRASCCSCSRVLTGDNEMKKYSNILGDNTLGVDTKNKKIENLILSLKNIKKCPHCQEKQYAIKLESPTRFMENDKRLSAIEIRTRLEKIPDDDLKLIGLDASNMRPEWGVLTVLPIPPVTMRPSITLETGERSEDDITHKLGDIVRINQRLFENINAGAPEVIVEDLWDLLQYHITTYFDNNIAQVPPARHRSGQPLKTLSERIKSKEGRFRHNLAGKRVNFSARTVISPDPKIKLSEVGIPPLIAVKLTIPERVTEWNLDFLKGLVKNGPSKYPGANYVIDTDMKKKKISPDTVEQILEELSPGYIVERHLVDGDISIFNRQPSLHRMSIMCHKIKVLPGRSFRLHPSVCTPYNADFDGDEMNLHIPQTEEARAEAEILMEVPTQIITPKSGLNIIAAIQDSVSGNYLLTKGMEFTKAEAASILTAIGMDKLDGLKEKMTGQDLFSMLLPNDFNFVGTSLGYKKGENEAIKGLDADVLIKNGKLQSGIIDSVAIGEGSGDIIRSLYKAYGSEKAIDILNNISKLGIEVLKRRGFTTGVSDTDVSEENKKEIEKYLKDSENKVEKLIESYKNGDLEPFPNKTLSETLELKILEVLNKVRNSIGELIAEGTSGIENGTIIMAKSGATGKIINLAQMAACVGQQALRGRRIEHGYSGRTLSLFKEGDLSPKAHGFVGRGFKQGLTAVEFFFAAMTGRDSLMDTALRTPKSGYLYRRLSNAIQDLKLEYDETVRDASNVIVQFKYGDDGIDVSKTDNGTINIKKIVREVKGGI